MEMKWIDGGILLPALASNRHATYAVVVSL